MTGTSLLPFLAGDAKAPHAKDYLSGIELFGRVAIRKGDTKLVWSNKPWGSESWELDDVAKDSAEAIDLAQHRSRQLAEMVQLW